MLSRQELKNRFDSISRSRSIVSSVECLSLHKVQSQINRMEQSRQYVKALRDIFFQQKINRTPSQSDKIYLLVFGNDHGMCSKLEKSIFAGLLNCAKVHKGKELSILVAGKRFYLKCCKAFNKVNINFAYYDPNDLTALGKRWISGEVSDIYVLYPQFVNIYSFQLKTESVFDASHCLDKLENLSYFPVDKEDLLQLYLRAIVENARLENSLSSNALRGIRMKEAKECADNIINKCKIEMNIQRQGSITKELNELMIGN